MTKYEDLSEEDKLKAIFEKAKLSCLGVLDEVGFVSTHFGCEYVQFANTMVVDLRKRLEELKHERD